MGCVPNRSPTALPSDSSWGWAWPPQAGHQEEVQRLKGQLEAERAEQRLRGAAQCVGAWPGGASVAGPAPQGPAHKSGVGVAFGEVFFAWGLGCLCPQSGCAGGEAAGDRLVSGCPLPRFSRLPAL